MSDVSRPMLPAELCLESFFQNCGRIRLGFKVRFPSIGPHGRCRKLHPQGQSPKSRHFVRNRHEDGRIRGFRTTHPSDDYRQLSLQRFVRTQVRHPSSLLVFETGLSLPPFEFRPFSRFRLSGTTVDTYA